MWMKGWEAFGCTGAEPVIRQFHESDVGTNLRRMGTTPFGPGEVKMGVAGIHFTHADHSGWWLPPRHRHRREGRR